MKPKWMLCVISIFTIAGLLAACSAINLTGAAQPTPLPTVTAEPGVQAEGRVVPKEYAALALPVGGKIAEIKVSEGQRVEKDALLLSLGDREPAQAALEQAKLAQLTAQQQKDKLDRLAKIDLATVQQALAAANLAVQDAQKAWDEVDSDSFRNDLEDKQVAVQDAKDDLKDKQDTLDKYLNLPEDNATRKSAQDDVDQAEVALHEAERALAELQVRQDTARAGLDLALARQKEAQRSLDVRLNGPDEDDLALAQAQLDSAKAQVAAAQAALDQMDLKAPYAGAILKIYNLEAGELVSPGQTLITLANTDQWYVETKDLTELDVVQIEAGQKVSIQPDALPSVKLSGVVESIGSVYTEKSNDVLYTVRIRLENPDPQLRWGMTVQIKFPE